jgi:hypothetical protein
MPSAAKGLIDAVPTARQPPPPASPDPDDTPPLLPVLVELDPPPPEHPNASFSGSTDFGDVSRPP